MEASFQEDNQYLNKMFTDIKLLFDATGKYHVLIEYKTFMTKQNKQMNHSHYQWYLVDKYKIF